MWNQTKPPSVRDLAARIEARAADVLALRDLIGALRVEVAEARTEQRALQAALEAEQAARLEAVGAIHDRMGLMIHTAHERMDHLRDSSNNHYDRHEELIAVVDDMLERLQALEGQDEIPAAADNPPATPDPVASSCVDGGGGDTDGPMLPNRVGLYEPNEAVEPTLTTRMAYYDPTIEPPAVGAVSPDDADPDAAGVIQAAPAVVRYGDAAHG